MSIQEYQSTVDNWIRATGKGYFSVPTNSLLLMEEVGELVRITARQYGEQSWKGEKPDDLTIQGMKEDEISDIFFVLTCLANQMDIDLEQALRENIAKKTQRDKDRHK